MRHIYQLALSLGVLIGLGQVAQAQDVHRYNATADNGYGVVYSLPQTELEISAVVIERQTTPGDLHPWANKYLGIRPISQPQRSYEIRSIEVRSVGVADTSQRYLVAFDRKSVAPFVRLGQGNILFSINGSADVPKETSALIIPEEVRPDRSMPSLPREYSLATTQAKRAEIVANYIYDLRENALGVVTGDAEQMPKDGEAMRLALGHLRSEERRATRLFLGDTTELVKVHRWRVMPEGEDMSGRIVFRFSQTWGVLAPDDLSGDAVILDLRVIERAPASDGKDKRSERPEGIAYNLPGTAEVRLSLLGQELTKARLPITQLGQVQYLNRRMLNIKEGATTAVYLDMATGALVRVVNE